MIGAMDRLVILLALLAGGCGCPNASQLSAIDAAGGRYVGGYGDQAGCRARWLWFEPGVTDEDLTRLAPAIRAMSPETLQLAGQRGVTDRSIDLINGISGVRVVYLDGSGISAEGVRRLRPDIRVEHGAGYR
jgi:hypothetical protein